MESDAVAKVLNKYKVRMVGHIVVIGPGGVQLCSCLQLMRTSLQGRHAFAALITELKRVAEFKGASVHPRWRIRSKKWSLASAALRKFNGEGCGEGERCGEYSGGFIDDFEGAERRDSQEGTARDTAVSIVRGRMYANLMEISSRCVRKFVDNFDPNNSSPDDQAIFARLERDVDTFILGGRPVGRSDNLALIAGMGSPPIGKPPIAPTKTRKQSRVKNCFEGRSSRKKRKEGRG